MRRSDSPQEDVTRRRRQGHFREIYRRFPSDHAEVFATVLQIISKDDALPALIHCTSGKDRTGFAVAVSLNGFGGSTYHDTSRLFADESVPTGLEFHVGPGHR